MSEIELMKPSEEGTEEDRQSEGLREEETSK